MASREIFAKTNAAEWVTDGTRANFEEEFHRGVYVTTDRLAVMDGPNIDSNKVAEVTNGCTINVLEVVHRPHVKRVRARIEEPHGWITLLHTGTGETFANLLGPATRAANNEAVLSASASSCLVAQN